MIGHDWDSSTPHLTGSIEGFINPIHGIASAPCHHVSAWEFGQQIFSVSCVRLISDDAFSYTLRFEGFRRPLQPGGKARQKIIDGLSSQIVLYGHAGPRWSWVAVGPCDGYGLWADRVDIWASLKSFLKNLIKECRSEFH